MILYIFDNSLEPLQKKDNCLRSQAIPLFMGVEITLISREYN
jgi:hypothetical protein